MHRLCHGTARPTCFAKGNPLTELTLNDLGWSNFYLSQLEIEELETAIPARISAVHRTAVTGITVNATRDLILPSDTSAGDIAVGDWVLAHPEEHRVLRRLDRQSTLQRGNDYHHGERQLIAANIDTLFITTSCNPDFNVARLERYLALAHDAEITPVILLTKADQADDPEAYRAQAVALGRDLAVLAIDATSPEVADVLAPWCGKGQTVALAGSSGVGKTTLANALTGGDAATQGIREDDAHGRHTTSGRSLHRIPSGGWLIDTPGMRGLGVADVSAGIEATFPEISELTDACKFRDCKHEKEPGCAVQAAIAAGEVEPERLKRYQKLKREDQHATETNLQARERSRKLGKMIRSATAKKRR